MRKVIQIILSILFCFISAYAQENQDTLSYENTYWQKVSINEDKTARSDSRAQALNESEANIQKSVDILNQFCMLNKPSPNKDIGCLKAFSNLNEICEMREHKEFLRKFTHKTHQAVKKACLNWYDTQGRSENFFTLDKESCRDGFQSMNQSLITLRNSKNLLTDGYFTERYERVTCNEHRRYKNLCRYVDGDMKDIEPTDYSKLPGLHFSNQIQKNNCQPKNPNDMQALEYALRVNSHDPSKDVFKKIIVDLKKEMNSKNAKTLPACESVRSSYYNLKCDAWEKVSEEEPVYFDAGIRDKNRREKERGPASQPANSGQSR